MPRFEIIQAKPQHCGQMIRALRREQRDAFLMLGVDAHRHLRTCFEASYFTRAWLIDGKLSGLGGVFGSALSGAGYIWLALSQSATRYPIAIVKEARRQIDEISQTKRMLVASTLNGDTTARHFIGRLGFEIHSFGVEHQGWVYRRKDQMDEAA